MKSHGLYPATIHIGSEHFHYHDITGPERDGQGKLAHLPFVLRILLENLLRHHDSERITEAHVRALTSWNGTGGAIVPYLPARVILQDFTGVPAVVDLAAMRTSLEEAGGDPAKVNPVIPVDLIIDHSVTVDCHGTPDALACNVEREFERNDERYRFLRWAQEAFDRFRVFPPSVGICHQVNLEHLATVVTEKEIEAGTLLHPDTLVGTDSHTPMVNGIGVLGWGVGGIEAEACMLGLPLDMPLPDVVGVELTGRLTGNATATDLALTVTHLLRKTGVVGCFVEYFGEGLHGLTVEDRATVANMAPEYGATTGFFPVDDATLAYLRATGRSERLVTLVEAYTKAQQLFRDPMAPTPIYSRTIQLDLKTVVPAMAGPRRPQDLVPLENLPAALAKSVPEPSSPLQVHYADGQMETLRNGSIVLAAITSCTNTSNPHAMLLAGLVAKKAIALGLKLPRFVKASLAPGSLAVTSYLQTAGLLEPLASLGFHLAGYGCTTCIGNSGPLVPEVAKALASSPLSGSAVLSGNRNFEGRIHPQVRLSWLTAPALVVAAALAGTVDLDMTKDPLCTTANGIPVFLSDLWPEPGEVTQTARACLSADTFRTAYLNIRTANQKWNELPLSTEARYNWDDTSTYIRRPPFFDNAATGSRTGSQHHSQEESAKPKCTGTPCRILALLGDSVTTDHISPAGSIPADTPAGGYLLAHGVAKEAFNSYGSRRGNHEVMLRGTFANIRIRNRLVPEKEGGWTRHWPDGDILPIFTACEQYEKENVSLMVIAGAEYGTGSSRDWAAKGTALLGVKAVLARSFERIHRSNLVGMGVLPLQFPEGESAESWGLTGRETIVLPEIPHDTNPGAMIHLTRQEVSGEQRKQNVLLRLDSPAEFRIWLNGGILRQVLKDLVEDKA